MYPFGKNFNYHFIPLIDNEEVTLPTSTPPLSIYIYDEKPTRQEAINGTNAFATITPAWTETDTTSRTIVIPAIDDPDPESESLTQNYWIAINFYLQATEQPQLVVRRLILERPKSHSKRIAVVSADLEEVFPTLTRYTGTGDVTGYIDRATTLIKSFLRTKGYSWASIYRPDELALAVVYKALALFAHSQKGEEFKERFVVWNGESKDLLESLSIQFDEDENGEPETQKSTGTGWLVLR